MPRVYAGSSCVNLLSTPLLVVNWKVSSATKLRSSVVKVLELHPLCHAPQRPLLFLQPVRTSPSPSLFDIPYESWSSATSPQLSNLSPARKESRKEKKEREKREKQQRKAPTIAPSVRSEHYWPLNLRSDQSDRKRRRGKRLSRPLLAK